MVTVFDFKLLKSSEAVASLPQWKLRHCTHSENNITYITLNHIYVDILKMYQQTQCHINAWAR